MLPPTNPQHFPAPPPTLREQDQYPGKGRNAVGTESLPTGCSPPTSAVTGEEAEARRSWHG